MKATIILRQGILVKTYGQAGDLDKVLAAWDEMEARVIYWGFIGIMEKKKETTIS